MDKYVRKPKETSCWHFLVTYTDENNILRVLNEKRSQIAHGAYICHDIDKTDTHYHVILHLSVARPCDTVYKWFENFDGKNTFDEILYDSVKAYQYLTHTDEKSIEQGKNTYPESAIVDFGISEFLATKAKDGDQSPNIIQEMLDGETTITLVKKYGKNFIYHFDSFQRIVFQIQKEQKKTIIDDEIERLRFENADLRSENSKLKWKTSLKY